MHVFGRTGDTPQPGPDLHREHEHGRPADDGRLHDDRVHAARGDRRRERGRRARTRSSSRSPATRRSTSRPRCPRSPGNPRSTATSQPTGEIVVERHGPGVEVERPSARDGLERVDDPRARDPRTSHGYGHSRRHPRTTRSLATSYRSNISAVRRLGLGGLREPIIGGRRRRQPHRTSRSGPDRTSGNQSRERRRLDERRATADRRSVVTPRGPATTSSRANFVRSTRPRNVLVDETPSSATRRSGIDVGELVGTNRSVTAREQRVDRTTATTSSARNAIASRRRGQPGTATASSRTRSTTTAAGASRSPGETAILRSRARLGEPRRRQRRP